VSGDNAGGGTRWPRTMRSRSRRAL
jgi:hypothetical protein